MNVKHLIELLQTCNQEAEVVIGDAPLIDDDQNINEGKMQTIVCIEEGYTDDEEYINSVKTFNLQTVKGYLVPGVRLVGYSDELTRDKIHLTINGVKADLSAPSAPVKWADNWEKLIGDRMTRSTTAGQAT